MAAAPLEGRIHPAAVWTGHELIVVGGYRDDVAQPGESVDAFTSDGRQLHFTSFVDGAAYDPATDRWRPIADAPGTGVTEDAVWTGSRLLVRGTTTPPGDDAGGAAVFSYDPASDRWEVLPAPTGVADTLDVTMTWTGQELVFWGHPYRRYEEPALSVALDPATGDWRTLPAGPLPSGMGPAATWDGDEVVVVAAGAVSTGTAPPPTPVAGLDPATNAWRQLPSAPTELQGMTPTVAWTGTDLLLTGGINGDRRNEVVLAFDPDGERWSEVGRMDGHSLYGSELVWTGDHLVEIGGQLPSGDPTADVVTFDPAAGSRRELPSLLGPRSNAGTVWTGSELLVWGGQPDAEGIDTALATGERLTLRA